MPDFQFGATLFGISILIDLDIGGAPAASYSPVVIAELWDHVQIAEFIVPPVGYGFAKVKVKSGQKIDEKAGQGTDKASLTQGGVNLTKGTIEITCTHQGWWPYLHDVLRELDPNNPDRLGGPFDVVHPEFTRRNCVSILIENVGEVEWEGAGVMKCTLDICEWQEPPPPTDDATTTPEDAEKTSDDSSGKDTGDTSKSSDSSSNSTASSEPDASSSGSEPTPI